MDTTAGTPVEPAPVPEALRVGDHVHQLLNLVHAMASQAASASSDAPGTGSTLGVDVGAMSDSESRQWSQDLETLLRYGHALAVQSAGDQDQRASAGRYAETGATSSVSLLVQSLHLSVAEASRRIHLAKQVLPIVDTITGAIAPTSHPALSQALFNGTLSQERALAVSHYLEEATRLAGNGRITEEEGTEVEEFLVNAAASQGPDSIRHLGNRIMANLDPDGNKPSTADLKAKQGLFFRKAAVVSSPSTGPAPSNSTNNSSPWSASPLTPTNTPTSTLSITMPTGPKSPPRPTRDLNGAWTPALFQTAAINCRRTGDGSTEDVKGSTNTSAEPRPQCDGQSSLINMLHDAATLFSTDTDCTQNDPGGPIGSVSNGNEPAPDSGPDSDSDSDFPSSPQFSTQSPPPPRLDQDPPESQDPAEPATQPQSPTPGTSHSVPEWQGNGWRRRLEPWEVPPRPPGAPENAIPPSYPGDPWFWFTTDPTTTGWNPIPTTGDFAACEPRLRI